MAGTNPLNFVRSVPRNGATGVSRNPRIQLVFTLNVVDDSVWINNKNQIRLFRGNTRIGINVIRSSDRALRRNIFVSPTNTLSPLTDYRLVILPGLTARNGMQLGETVTIRFRTTSSGSIPEE
ncbi:MAG: Ig-like domain-containing protein [Syntrophomonadaceae bacterium]|nr:Ig-like domain-containing protein [Syntrophomonadaceae bacterium]